MAKRTPSPQPDHEDVPQGAEISPYPTTLIQYTNLPDKIAYVDLISAQIFNQNRAAIRDLTRELGIELKGNCYDLHDRLSRVIDPDGRLVLPETVVSVGKQNADFTTIQAAVDSITDASASKTYILHIYPGIYEENVILKPNILLKAVAPIPRGSNRDTFQFCVIAPPNGPCIKLTTSGYYYFEGMTLKPTGASAFAHETGYSASCHVFFHFGSITGPEMSMPLVTASHLIRFHFFKSRLLLPSSDRFLFNIAAGDVSYLPAYFSHTQLDGSIRVASPDIDAYAPIFSACYMFGDMQLACNDTRMKAFNSYFGSVPGGMISIKTTSNSYVHAFNSQFFNEDEEFAVIRSSGGVGITLKAAQCIFAGSPDTDILDEYSDGSNTFNKVIFMECEDF